MARKDGFERLRRHVAGLERPGTLKPLAPNEKPYPGMTFFLAVPPEHRRGRPRSSEKGSDGHALLAVLKELGAGLFLCCKMSLETGMAGSHDLTVMTEQWGGGYDVMVEAWNSLVVHRFDIDNRHADLPAELVRNVKLLFTAYQHGTPAPAEIKEVGPPLEPSDERLDFQHREAELVERARVSLHERPGARIITLAIRARRPAEPANGEHLLACADAGETFTKVREAWSALAEDIPVYETADGSMYVRVKGGALFFLWFSERGVSPPPCEARPPLKEPGVLESDGTGLVVGVLEVTPDLETVTLRIGGVDQGFDVTLKVT